MCGCSVRRRRGIYVCKIRSKKFHLKKQTTSDFFAGNSAACGRRAGEKGERTIAGTPEKWLRHFLGNPGNRRSFFPPSPPAPPQPLISLAAVKVGDFPHKYFAREDFALQNLPAQKYSWADIYSRQRQGDWEEGELPRSRGKREAGKELRRLRWSFPASLRGL